MARRFGVLLGRRRHAEFGPAQRAPVPQVDLAHLTCGGWLRQGTGKPSQYPYAYVQDQREQGEVQRIHPHGSALDRTGGVVKERRAEERLERLLALQTLLARVARDLGPATELASVLTTVLSAMRSLIHFRGGSVGLVTGGEIRIAAADPAPTPDVLDARLPIGQGLAGRVVATGEAIFCPDLDADERVDPGLRRLGSNAGMKSYLAVPLICLGQVIGLLQVDAAE